jgi:hypothetical protein
MVQMLRFLPESVFLKARRNLKRRRGTRKIAAVHPFMYGGT